MQHIVAATDGSEGADRAVDIAAKVATAFGATLIIVTVAGNLSGEETRELARGERNIGDALEARLTQILTTAEKRAQRLGLADIQLEIGWGARPGRLSISPRAKPPMRLFLEGAAATDWPVYCSEAYPKRLEVLPLVP